MPLSLDPAIELRTARRRAGLTQQRLARLAGTSQSTVATYEAGRKQPSLATLERLLSQAGARLQVSTPPRIRSEAELRRAGKLLVDVILLAEELPFTRTGLLRFPALSVTETE